MATSEHTVHVGMRLAPERRTHAALIALGWTPPDEDPGAETNLWHVLVHVPIGREDEVPELLDAVGFETYRMWDTASMVPPEASDG
ncbi:MAG TPA: hypothetical protein VGS19_28995 [Streptosporangiaceae bacterium]|nr:hypothetical protein [Streptosporangiaceae bacterium]